MSVVANGKWGYTIELIWDNEAAVWTATSTDIPGLILEAGSIDALLERVRCAVPEILEMNGSDQEQINIDEKAITHLREVSLI